MVRIYRVIVLAVMHILTRKKKKRTGPPVERHLEDSRSPSARQFTCRTVNYDSGFQPSRVPLICAYKIWVKAARMIQNNQQNTSLIILLQTLKLKDELNECVKSNTQS